MLLKNYNLLLKNLLLTVTNAYKLAPKNRQITPEITEELPPKSLKNLLEI